MLDEIKKEVSEYSQSQRDFLKRKKSQNMQKQTESNRNGSNSLDGNDTMSYNPTKSAQNWTQNSAENSAAGPWANH